MSERFVNVDRDTPMLLPPSLQDWLPEGHLAHFVVETVTLLPLHGFKVNTRWHGQRTVSAFDDAESVDLQLRGWAHEFAADREGDV